MFVGFGKLRNEFGTRGIGAFDNEGPAWAIGASASKKPVRWKSEDRFIGISG